MHNRVHQQIRINNSQTSQCMISVCGVYVRFFLSGCKNPLKYWVSLVFYLLSIFYATELNHISTGKWESFLICPDIIDKNKDEVTKTEHQITLAPSSSILIKQFHTRLSLKEEIIPFCVSNPLYWMTEINEWSFRVLGVLFQSDLG